MTTKKSISKKLEPAAIKPVQRLTRKDWVDAAFEAVVQHGFEGVRVLSLAEKLGVTRGSFYWHFGDHSALIDGLVHDWRESELSKCTAMRGVASGTPQNDMEQILDLALAHGGDNLENMRFELALRGLGRRDEKIATLLAQVDDARLDLLRFHFERLTLDAQKAIDLAALFYLSIVGCYQALARPTSPPALKDYFKGLINAYLIQAQAHKSAVLKTTPKRKP